MRGTLACLRTESAEIFAHFDGFPHAEYKDASGKTLVETYTITGQSHGTEVAPAKSIDPAQASSAKCGKAGAYILSAGICSTYYAGKFFGLDGAGAAPTSDGGGLSSSSSTGGTGAASGGAGPGTRSGSSGDSPGKAGSSCSVGGARSGRANTVFLTGAALAAALLLRRRRRLVPARR